jgi:hypothetical protein
MFDYRTFLPGALRLGHSAEGNNMTDAFICDAIRTPIGRYGASLSSS